MVGIEAILLLYFLAILEGMETFIYIQTEILTTQSKGVEILDFLSNGESHLYFFV
jgi:hypothetical protein